MERVDPLPDEALETGKLVLELIHAAYASRDVDVLGAPGHGAAGAISQHAVRAAIHIHEHGERTVGELAAGLGISMGWASRVVSELEASGMLHRIGDRADRRIVRVALEPRAVAVVEAAYRWRGDAIGRALAGLGRGEREAVRRFLRQAVAELGTRRETP